MNRLDVLLEFSKTRPEDPFVHYGLAMEYKNLGQLEEAIAVFMQLIEKHPDYTATYLHAGNALVTVNRRQEARKIYEAGVAACIRKGDAHAQGELEGALGAL